MSRRRNLLTLAAVQQERERQSSVRFAQFKPLNKTLEMNNFTVCFNISKPDIQLDDMWVIGSSSNTMSGVYFGYSGIRPIFYGRDCNGEPLYFYIANIATEGVYTFVFEQGVAKWYHNGIFISEKSGYAPIQNIPLTMIYGRPNFRRDFEFRSLRVFNYALSAAEVATIYNGGRPEEYVLPTWQKTMKNAYQSDFTSEKDGWTGVGMSSATIENGVLNIESTDKDYKIKASQKGAVIAAAKYNVEVEFAEPIIGGVRVFYYFPFSVGSTLVLANIPDGTTSIKGVVNLMKDTGIASKDHFLYLIGVDTPQTFKIKSIRVTPVGCIAEYLPQNIVTSDGIATTWLDSARQLPMNNEYLPPLLQSAGGYDLAANGTPEIICKPTLCQHWQMKEPMTLEGVSYIVPGYTVAPKIVEGAIRITSNETANSYGGGVKLINILEIKPGDCFELSFEVRGFGELNRAFVVIAGSGGNFWYSNLVNLASEYQQFVYSVVSTYSCRELWLVKPYGSIIPGGFDVKNIQVKIYRK